MFPWNYGFHWNAGTMIFLGAFYSVLLVVVITLIFALCRSRRTIAREKLEQLRWHADFEDLPDHTCRHVLTGEFRERECPNAFDCRRCETHARLIARAQPPAPGEVESEVLGLSFPANRYYHRGHAWAEPEPDGTVRVGLDDLAQRIVGEPDSIELPVAGTHVEANGTAFRLRRRGADVRILSPVDGVVVETGGAGSGWYLRVQPPKGDPFRHLLRGAEVRPWVSRELERLHLALSEEGVPALPDGGSPVRDIAAAYPRANWDTVCGTMFLEP